MQVPKQQFSLIPPSFPLCPVSNVFESDLHCRSAYSGDVFLLHVSLHPLLGCWHSRSSVLHFLPLSSHFMAFPRTKWQPQSELCCSPQEGQCLLLDSLSQHRGLWPCCENGLCWLPWPLRHCWRDLSLYWSLKPPGLFYAELPDFSSRWMWLLL